MTIKELREDASMTLKAFVDWLLDSHIHFLLCYVHQGLESFGWDVTDIIEELQRLKYHEGFPNGEQLSCPIFTQDKMRYLQLIPHHTLKSYAIVLPKDSGEVDDMYYQNVHHEVSRYG